MILVQAKGGTLPGAGDGDPEAGQAAEMAQEVDDAEVDPTEYMIQGKGLKHEADKEPDRERQAMKYLQAVLYFILYAHANEQRNEKQGAFTIYQETLNLVK